MCDKDPVRARQLIAGAGLDKLSLESVGWLLSVLSGDKDSVNEVAAIRHLLNNRVTETAGAAHFVRPSHLGVVFSSTNVLIIEMSLGDLTEKRIPRPSAYGLASENIFLIAAGSELAIARP
jgi:hypothetical protein